MKRLRRLHRQDCRKERILADEEGHEHKVVVYTKPFKSWLRSRGLFDGERTQKAMQIAASSH